MTKAEEYAKKYYPRMWVNKTPTSMTKVDMNEAPRRAAMLAYKQAEKDLALTWEDMKLVIAAEGSIYDEHHGNSHEVFENYPTEEAFYGEVLKRYNELKRNEKDNSI